jgi:DNA-binding NtrC family response regulator
MTLIHILAEQLGGKIEFRSRREWRRLPLPDQPEEAKARGRIMANRLQCILLVDDEQNILNALSRELRDWAAEHELEILTADLGRKGLQILAERGGDTVIVVSDLKMPEMKGSDFLLSVRENYPDIVTILLTGFSETEEVIKAVRAGIFSYMLKPWDRIPRRGDAEGLRARGAQAPERAATSRPWRRSSSGRARCRRPC